MRKIAVLTGLLGIAFLCASTAASLQGYVDTLSAAKSLKAEYSVNVVGGGSKKAFSVELSKPNMARIDRENELVIADGKDILTFDKKANTYYKRPQTAAELNTLFADDELSIFKPFFDAKSFAGISASDGGTKTRKGMQLRLFNGTMDKGRKLANFYIDDQNLARQVELVYPDKDIRWLIDTQSFAVNGETSADAFAFKAPSGARELSLEEMSVGKWFHNLDEAAKIAKATNKIIMIDFMTTWCGPCKIMAAEAFTSEPFMERAKNFVLCKLDAEVETGLAAKYSVTAYPTVVFIKPDGTMVHKFVGYGGIHQVCGDMDKALANR